MSGYGAVVGVHSSALFRLDLERVEEIMRERGIDCEISRSGSVVVAEVGPDATCVFTPLLKNLEKAIEKQLGEAGLVRRASPI